jgi:hypothetical protein
VALDFVKAGARLSAIRALDLEIARAWSGKSLLGTCIQVEFGFRKNHAQKIHDMT